MAGISKSQKLELSNIAVELDKEEVGLIRYGRESYITMTSVARLVNTLKSCKYAVENNIPEEQNFKNFFKAKNYTYLDRIGQDEIFYNNEYFKF